jgi:hypothetical protein
MVSAQPTTDKPEFFNPFATIRPMENGSQLTATQIVDRALGQIESHFGADGAATVHALRKSLRTGDGRPTKTIGNRFTQQVDVDQFYHNARTMRVGEGQDVRDGIASLLGAGNFATLRVYNNLASEINRIERVAGGQTFPSPANAKAVETVTTGLAHAANWFATPVLNGAIASSTSRQIMAYAQELEKTVTAKGHPFPRAFAMVQSIAHIVGTMKDAGKAEAEVARQALIAESHKPNLRTWTGVTRAQEKWEAAKEAVKPFEIAGKPIGEIVARFKGIEKDWPDALRVTPVPAAVPLPVTRKENPVIVVPTVPRPAEEIRVQAANDLRGVLPEASPKVGPILIMNG